MANINNVKAAFVGMVARRTYAVCHAIEWGQAYIGKSVERVYRFEGLNYEDSHEEWESVTALDASGKSHTVSFQHKMVMSRTNPPHVAESNTVSITKRSPRLYDVEVTHTTTTDGNENITPLT